MEDTRASERCAVARWDGGGGGCWCEDRRREPQPERRGGVDASPLAQHPWLLLRGGWDEFAPLFLDGKVESSSIWEWHRGWWEAAASQPDCVLLVHFEDLKADLPAELARVAAHLGLQRSAEELQAVAARCGFGAMKAATCY